MLGLAIVSMFAVGGMSVMMTMVQAGVKTIGGQIILKVLGLTAVFSLPLIALQLLLNHLGH